jgi:hypothetical protein
MIINTALTLVLFHA